MRLRYFLLADANQSTLPSRMSSFSASNFFLVRSNDFRMMQRFEKSPLKLITIVGFIEEPEVSTNDISEI